MYTMKNGQFPTINKTISVRNAIGEATLEEVSAHFWQMWSTLDMYVSEQTSWLTYLYPGLKYYFPGPFSYKSIFLVHSIKLWFDNLILNR